jgi:hypothetical protein
MQQLQTDWGWAAILLMAALILPFAIWWGHREAKARSLLVRVGFPALAIAYVLLTAAFAAAFSMFGDLGWLWRISISAPIGTAAIAVLLLTPSEGVRWSQWVGLPVLTLGVTGTNIGATGIVESDYLAGGIALLIVGVALSIIGVGLIVGKPSARSLLMIGLGVVQMGIGAVFIVGNNLLYGIGMIGLGVVQMGIGAAFIVGNTLLLGIGMIGFGVVAIGFGVASIVADKLAYGVGEIALGVVAIGIGVYLCALGRKLRSAHC